ncbi:MAG: DEAD/DEAH box helicase [Acidimicrobiales bacterium]|nr:DEAD/DEAH box helicase [Acidimicrobiales bacterium]
MSGFDRTTFLAGYGFALDAFQRRALDAIDAGESVLVAAPTGSGKTLVAEYAVARAVAEGGRAFYTTPIKALSNQKYADFGRRYGAGRVGLLTGDNSINGDAPVVVMTTEVLRNMIYTGSAALERLHVVILDEVHYLQDAYRGPVWEEVIVHAPREVRLVCLSATVSNADELAGWISTVRGPTAVVVAHDRPVPLQHLCAVGDRTSERLLLLPTLVDGRPNPELERLEAEGERRPGPRGRPRRRLFTPRRVEVVERLRDEEMLPAITFVFSRVGCDEAARTCLDSGLRLTTDAERARIRAIVEQRLGGLSDADLAVLGYGRWLAALEAGFAPHHAGMVPPFKEAVEACFVEGLVKVVFATETLALGVNMPARAVVIERLSKFGGERHQLLKPGEYTQLTGRGGRRGIDEVGYAVVLWSPFVPFGQVAALAASRSYALTSAFRPTYNMAANLVRRYPPELAHHLLNLSFGQYQADREVVRLEARLEQRAATLVRLREEASCELGDVEEYRRLLRQAAGPAAERAPRGLIERALAQIRPGDVLVLPGRRPARPAVVLTVASRRGGATRLRALTADQRLVSLAAADFDEPPRRFDQIDLPRPYAPHRPSFQREAARLLRALRSVPEPGAVPDRRRPRGRGSVDHPVARCPDADRHVRAGVQAERVAREVGELRDRITTRTESLARHFDRVLRILEGWGYLEGWALTPAGERLARLYHECDLLVAECLEHGLFDGLDPAGLAGLLSCFTYEHRSPEPPPPPWFPSPEVRRRWAEVEGLAAELQAAEEEAGLPLTRPPDPTFCALAHGWAAGEGLHDVLEDEDLSGGDFVRNVRQLIDLLRQLADLAPDPATATSARTAAARLDRGVVSASGAVAVAAAAAGSPP